MAALIPPLKPYHQLITTTIPFIYRSSSPKLSTTKMSASVSAITQRKLPVLLFDIMDTIVHDPFYHDIPAFFR
ncbi:hypothetical protein HanLR1_Chr16g0620821 [Helianthus annuus]|nr:hypothetical protein HanLR1_Chr16g0620821 [Helianthus annuus]